MKKKRDSWQTFLGLSAVFGLARILAAAFRPSLIVSYGILILNLFENVSLAAFAIFLAAALAVLIPKALKGMAEKRGRDAFVERMQEGGSESEADIIKLRLQEQAKSNPELQALYWRGLEQIKFIENMIDDFESVFSGAKDSKGVRDAILEELEKDMGRVLENLADVLRWSPSPAVRKHYDDYVKNMEANLKENDITIGKYEDLRFVALQYLENKRARPDRDVGIESLYEAIKTLTEREKAEPFPREGTGGLM